MSIYLVTYDLYSSEQHNEKLLNLIRAASSWARLGESSYLIKSDESVSTLRDEYAKVLDANDRLFITAVDRPAAWYSLPKEVDQWIRDNYE